MTKRNMIATSLAFALALAPVAVLAYEPPAYEPPMEEEAPAEAAVLGCLEESVEGGFELTAEGQDSVTLSGGEAELSGLVGQIVQVTGTWATDAEGNEVLEVSGAADTGETCGPAEELPEPEPYTPYTS